MKPYYEHGGVSIYHGDCREVVAWLNADVLVTDPPYGMDYESGWQPRAIANDGDVATRDEALALWGDKPALVFGRWSEPPPSAARACLTWDKGDWPGMGDLSLPWGPSTEQVFVLGSGFVGKRAGSVIRVRRLTGGTLHPNEKPRGLIRSLIERTPPEWTVADPFMGSGSTLVAAKDLGRRAIGVELDERYCEIAAKRLGQEVLPFVENRA